MQEIVIDHKKYISSKQAAEATGYAKDYIGQLCREGRIPARLIGRSWYVLESALHDHRFGAEEPKKATGEDKKEKTSAIDQTWEAPKYKSETAEYFPSINKLLDEKPKVTAIAQNVEASGSSPVETMHEAWKEWFSRPKEDAREGREARREEPAASEDAPEVKVPIHTIYKEDSGPSIEMRHIEEAKGPQEEEVKAPESTQRAPLGVFGQTVRFLSLAFVFLSISIWLLGFGYLDKFISSNTVLARLAGITIINNK